jgi:hypothetical protein
VVTEQEGGAVSDRFLNHVELVYRPGERELAKRVLSLFGCNVVDRGGTFFSAMVEPTVSDFVNNALYASEMTPQQAELEAALSGALAEGAADAGDAYRSHLRSVPQRSCHFGIRWPDLDALESQLECIAESGRDDPDLAGRVGVSAVFRPGEPGSLTETMLQAFVHTDVVASGLVLFGQHVELQWHVPGASVPAATVVV